MYRLYNYQPSGNCYKVRLLLNQLEYAYETEEINLLNGESRSHDFLAINANGRTPVLMHEGHYLAESNAILWYLAQNTAFLSSDEWEQAQILQWMFFEQYSHEPHIATVRYWVSILKQPETYKALIKEKMKMGYAALDVMEKHLSRHTYFVGEQYSIADIALYAYTHVASEGGYDLDKYSCIRNWLDKVESQENHISIYLDPQHSG